MQMFDRHIWRSKISTHQNRLYNVYILPVFLYGAETWSITKDIERRINALGQWCLRRILNITWSQEPEAAYRSSEAYLAENVGGRPASVQPRSCIRVQEGTGQNYLARTHGYVTDKPRMMMMMPTPVYRLR